MSIYRLMSIIVDSGKKKLPERTRAWNLERNQTLKETHPHLGNARFLSSCTDVRQDGVKLVLVHLKGVGLRSEFNAGFLASHVVN